MSITVQLEDRLLDTGINVQLVQEALTAGSGSKSKVKSWTATKIGQNRGYVSHMVRLCLEWTADDEKLPKSVVLKLPTTEIMASALDKVNKEMEGASFEEKMPDFETWDATKLIRLAQRAECAFYNYAKGADWNVEHLLKCYLANVEKPAVLIFDDLSDCHFIEFADGLTLRKMLQIADMLANLHAYCIKNPSFKDFPDLHYPGCEMFNSVCDSFVASFKSQAVAAKKTWPHLFDPLADRLPEIAKSKDDLAYVWTLNETFSMPTVLVHGDLHVQNLAFDKADNDILRAAFDWQGVHTGCVVEDFGRILCMCGDPEIRRDRLEEILSYYYSALSNNLKPMQVPFSFVTLQRAYEKAMRFATAMSVGALIMMASVDDILGENAEVKRQKLLIRSKCLLEDVLELMDAGKT